MLFTMATTAVAFGEEPSIFGRWQLSIKNQGTDYLFSLNILERSTIFSLKCTSDGQTGEVSAELATKIDGYKYQVMGSVNKGVDVGEVDCRLRIPADDMTFDTDGRQLKLVSSRGDPVFFNRVE